jgi:hypothetical protein
VNVAVVVNLDVRLCVGHCGKFLDGHSGYLLRSFCIYYITTYPICQSSNCTNFIEFLAGSLCNLTGRPGGSVAQQDEQVDDKNNHFSVLLS